MFKGLRTKIESEQKVQSGKKPDSPNLSKNDSRIPKLEHQTAQALREIPTEHNETINVKSIVKSEASLVNTRILETPSADVEINYASNSMSHQTNVSSVTVSPDRVHVNTKTSELLSQIAKLKEQLDTVMREKEESNDQNLQLYQLIEKLRRNLEDEKEANSSLRSKLSESENRLSEFRNRLLDKSKNISIESKSLDAGLLADKKCTANNIDDLRNQMLDLQAEVKKKTRLIRIREQNLNDLKKTLQREILEHGKTQEELIRTQRLFKESNLPYRNTSPNPNGCIPNDPDDATGRITDPNKGKIKATPDSSSTLEVQSNSSFVTSDKHVGEDAISLSAGGAATNVQLDRLSYLSHSSASIDEFESNDPQRNNFSKEVNHEYLRNVLFRYMTSTDTETTQHLVKAISVLMDFSPEQSTAIRNVTSARSSWLRLK